MYRICLLSIAVLIGAWNSSPGQAPVETNQSDSEYNSEDIQTPDPDTMTDEEWDQFWESILDSDDTLSAPDGVDSYYSGDSIFDYYPYYADEALLDTARAWILDGQSLDDIVAIVSNYIYYDSADADAWYLLGNAMNQKENLGLALEYYHKSIEQAPSYPYPYIDIAYIFDVFANPDSMNYYMRQGMTYSIEPESLYYDYGYSFDLMSEFDSAMVYYHKWLDIYPNDEMACINIGGILGNRGDIDSAYYYTYKAYLMSPDSPDACYNLAMIYKIRDENQNAIDYYQKALAINPKLVAAKYNLGELYEVMGDSSMARIFFREFVDEAPPTYLNDIQKAKAKLGIDE
jgi:tetratricopeptide (TPR) repeat protein